MNSWNRYLKAALIIVLVAACIVPADAKRGRKKKKKKAKSTTERSIGALPDSVSKSMLLVYPVSMFTSTLKAGYEQYLAPKKSLNFSMLYSSGEGSRFYNMTDFREVGGELQYKIYLGKKFQHGSGFYMGPYGLYRNIVGDVQIVTRIGNRSDTAVNRLGANALNFGYVFGFQKIIAQRLVISAYAGGGLNLPTGSFRSMTVGLNLYGQGVIPHFGLGIGLML